MNQTDILAQIKKGMTVFDRKHDTVGTVSFVQLSDEIPVAPGPETVTSQEIVESGEVSLLIGVTEAFAGEARMPKEVRQSLLREGFIRVDPGILRADRYMPSEQIDSVSTDGVLIGVEGSELIKG
jgi:hypothetical protein